MTTQLALNTKPLEMPYGLYRVEYLRQYVSDAEQRFIQWTGNPYSKFNGIFGQKGMEIFQPECFAALEALRINLDAIAAGLLMNPPVIVPPIPIDPNLPIDPPVHEPMPNNVNALARWKYTSQTATDFTLATRELKDSIKLNLPPEIYDSLVIQGGATGWAAITPGDIFDLILSDEYGEVTPTELKAAQAKISVMWKKDISLRANLENMKEANNTIAATFPHLRLSEQDMFRIAYDIGISTNFRLISTINKFMDLPGQGYTISNFTQFMAYLLLHYPKEAHLPGREHLAFFGEGQVDKKEAPPKFALSALNVTEEEDQEDGLALAALGKHEWNQKNWDLYQKLLKKPPPKGPPKPPPVIPAGTQLGKICFNCGWNTEHNSRRCPVMLNAPPNSFTPAQMALVKFSPSRNPHSIDGKPINQQCAPGVHGWP